jgi:hypothetical protein
VVERKNGKKSGFRLPDRIAVLDFSDTEYDGAEVRLLLNVPLGLAFQIQDLVEEGKERQMVDEFANSVLVGWNLVDNDGNDIPSDADGMQQVDSAFLTTVMQKWSEVVGQPPSPLSEISENGNTSEGQLVEMEMK